MKDKSKADIAGDKDAARTLKAVAGGDQDAPERDPFQRVIHERMRLAIVGALAVNDSLSFGELKKLLDTTDGNLSVHTQKLEAAGFLVSMKSFEGRTPRTEFQLTARGRTALARYLEQMESLIRVVREK